jgi:hypothetical protein
MQLPGSLAQSTLGDLLGALHRAGQSGTLDLRETKGPQAGRVHRIHLQGGLVTAVQLRVIEGDATPPDEAACDRAHVIQSIDFLYALPDARLSFHVARRRSDSARPLPTADYLHGRPRRRDTFAGRAEAPAKAVESQRGRALATLGLSSNASLTEAHRAFRLLALKLHPDHHGDAPEAEKKSRTARFLSVLAAYQELVAKAG